MKPLLPTTIRLLGGTGLGFAAAVLFVRLSINAPAGPESSSSTPPGSEARTGGAGKPGSAPVMPLPAAGSFEKLSPREKLAAALQLRGIPPARRLAWLQECVQRDEPERTALLSILLCQWAETDPAAAAEWALSSLKGMRTTPVIQDIMRTWAARDGESLAHWLDDQLRKNPGGSGGTTREWSLVSMLSMQALGVHDPFQMAGFGEMKSMAGATFPPMDFARSQRTPEAVKAMAGRLRGHVTYPDDPELLKQSLEKRSGLQAIATQDLFRQLFEDTAAALHRMDPAACDQWLSGWPENARFAARYAIGRAEEKAETESASGPPASPAVSSSSAGEAGAAGTESKPPAGPASGGPESPAPVFNSALRPDPASPADGASAEHRISSWTRWWRQDAVAAEAFLKSADWPDSLKFHTRARAYSSAP